MTFGAETEMYRVLQTKARTLGRSTLDLGERNLHASLGVINVTGGKEDAAAVVRDRRLPVPGTPMRVARLDVFHALYSGERHRMAVAADRAALGTKPSHTQVPEPIKYGDLWLPYGTTLSDGGILPGSDAE